MTPSFSRRRFLVLPLLRFRGGLFLFHFFRAFRCDILERLFCLPLLLHTFIFDSFAQLFTPKLRLIRPTSCLGVIRAFFAQSARFRSLRRALISFSSSSSRRYLSLSRGRLFFLFYGCGKLGRCECRLHELQSVRVRGFAQSYALHRVVIAGCAKRRPNAILELYLLCEYFFFRFHERRSTHPTRIRFLRFLQLYLRFLLLQKQQLFLLLFFFFLLLQLFRFRRPRALLAFLRSRAFAFLRYGRAHQLRISSVPNTRVVRILHHDHIFIKFPPVVLDGLFSSFDNFYHNLR